MTVGVYDSGVGGLSVLKELYALMPSVDYLYVADTANCPYGDKSPEFIMERAGKVVRFLMENGAGAVVVACNTATAAAITYLREKFPIPVVGMEPAVKPAVQASRTGVIGVLATANTFKGSLYKQTSEKYGHDATIVEMVGAGLVEAVERGRTPVALISRYVSEITGHGADVIVLGCTHYPFLQSEIAHFAGPGVEIVNPAPAVALQTRRVIPDTDGTGTMKIYSTGDMRVLKTLTKRINPFIDDKDFAKIDI